jgi:N-ethylmaleimide reductase
MTSLFDPARFGDIALANRIVMAPLTRNRAPGQMPTPLMAAYYTQRASAGLLITEATPISPTAHGYADTPGIHTAAQAAAWRPITDAVHAAGGRIVVQLWHVGRVSHASVLPPGEVPVSSTARPASGARTLIHLPDGTLGRAECTPPRALRTEELPGVVADYAHAAQLAMEAGFDGVEIHAANGYLLEQFMRAGINDRSDAYGGDVAGRTRLVCEVLSAVAEAIGPGRTGIRVSPCTYAPGTETEADVALTYGAVAEHAGRLGLAFMEVVEGMTGGARDHVPFDHAALKAAFGGPWIVNNGYTRAMALETVASGAADAVAFGRPYIANPDLVRRLRDDLPWADYDRATCYGGGAEGYTLYPDHVDTATA